MRYYKIIHKATGKLMCYETAPDEDEAMAHGIFGADKYEAVEMSREVFDCEIRERGMSDGRVY